MKTIINIALLLMSAVALAAPQKKYFGVVECTKSPTSKTYESLIAYEMGVNKEVLNLDEHSSSIGHKMRVALQRLKVFMPITAYQLEKSLESEQNIEYLESDLGLFENAPTVPDNCRVVNGGFYKEAELKGESTLKLSGPIFSALDRNNRALILLEAYVDTQLVGREAKPTAALRRFVAALAQEHSGDLTNAKSFLALERAAALSTTEIYAVLNLPSKSSHFSFDQNDELISLMAGAETIFVFSDPYYYVKPLGVVPRAIAVSGSVEFNPETRSVSSVQAKEETFVRTGGDQIKDVIIGKFYMKIDAGTRVEYYADHNHQVKKFRLTTPSKLYKADDDETYIQPITDYNLTGDIEYYESSIMKAAAYADIVSIGVRREKVDIKAGEQVEFYDRLTRGPKSLVLARPAKLETSTGDVKEFQAGQRLNFDLYHLVVE